ncbi:MAG: uroporphyrinogen-III synthase [Armatimonadota bacterium]|nr:uroporphyrinogen-III synthase [Armatimonadota bacterium]MDW8156580.1 uroporphyrinogen-III synthase [Armatimonadota bacterium]
MSWRVVLLESRWPQVLADLVRRQGWEPVCAPAVEEVPVPAEEVADPLRRLCALEVDWAVFLTGVGVERLYDAAQQLKLTEAFVRALQRVPVAVRGPKPVAVLGRWGVHPRLSAPSPHTTEELCAALAAVDLSGRRVFVQHYGEPNARLRDFLLVRGAEVVDALPYRWALPQDTAPLASAVRALVAGEADALVVTSRPQVLHLFAVAEQQGLHTALREALNGPVVVAAVGPTSQRTLESFGVRVTLTPEHPKMRPLVAALASHWAGQA